MNSIRISSNFATLFVLFLTAFEEIRFEVGAERISSQAKNDSYKDELFKEMAKVFKILKEHPLTENPLSISDRFSHFSYITDTGKRNRDPSLQIHDRTTTQSDEIFAVPSKRNGKKKTRSVDLKYRRNLKNISPLSDVNSDFLNVEFPIDSYTEGFENKWVNRKYRLRRFNNHKEGHKKSWRQALEQSYGPEDNLRLVPFGETITPEVERKKRRRHYRTSSGIQSEEIFPAFNEIRGHFKRLGTPGNSLQKHSDVTKGRRKYGRNQRHRVKLHSHKTDERGKLLNHLKYSTEISPKLINVKYESRKKVSEKLSSTTALNFHLENFTQAQQLIESEETSTATSNHSTVHKSKRNFLEDISLNEIKNIFSVEDNSFIDQFLKYFQSHLIIGATILAISFTTVISLGIVTFYIVRKHTKRRENTRKYSPKGIQSFDLPARPDFNSTVINTKTKTSKCANGKMKLLDDSKSMFSIDSQSSTSESNSKDLLRSNKHTGIESSNQDFSESIRSTGKSSDTRNICKIGNRLDGKAGERLLKLHRNYSFRNSIHNSSGSQQSTKSSPVQRREELAKFSQKRAKSSSENGSPIVPKPTDQKPVRPKTPTNPFEEDDETSGVKDLQDIIRNVQISSYVPPLESKLACVNRLLRNKPSGFKTSPTGSAGINNTKTHRDVAKELLELPEAHSLAKYCNDISHETTFNHEGFSDDEPGIDY